MDQYTQNLAKYPNSDGRISYIGHSNGTYILASALDRYPSLRVNQIVFAGSVVRTDYDRTGSSSNLTKSGIMLLQAIW